jgi:hypothetical protein
MNNRELAEELIKVTGAAALIDQTMTSMIDQITAPMFEDDPELAAKLVPVVKEAFLGHTDGMVDITIGGYVSTFSEAELQGILDFYKSDIGTTFISRMPSLVSSNMRETQAYTEAVILPELESKMLEIMREHQEGSKEE